MRPNPSRDICVVGIGNSLAGDDAAGLVAAQRLRPRLEGRASVIPIGMASHALLQVLEDARAAIVIDAVRSGAPAGTIRRIDLSGAEGLARLREGDGHVIDRGGMTGAEISHGPHLAETLALGAMLHILPSRLILYGIEGDHMLLGEGLSPSVDQALDRLVEEVSSDVEAFQCTKSTS